MELSQPTLRELTQLIHQWSGLVIGKNKAYLIRHRLEPVIRASGLGSFDELLNRLQARDHARLRESVIDAITTGETRFFRDPWFFDALLRHVLPECASRLKGSGRGRHQVRIWSAGSSTGQEAWSLAMIVREFLDESDPSLHDAHFSILAGDISNEAIQTAKAGSYSRTEVDRGVSDARLRKYFTHRGDRWIVNDSLRKLVQFRRFNLLCLPRELGTFDLALCRNVMIYFDEPTRARVCQSLRRALHPGGWLGLGAAESFGGSDAGIQSVKFGRAVLYRALDPGD
ncbi:MAG: CheR family methyltransferase [Tepidisphaeraceae bacterium]